MLNAMRNGAFSGIMKFFFLGLLMLAAGGMVFMDVGGFFRNGTGVNNVARVAGEDINAQAFDQQVQRIVARQGMSARQAYQFGLIDQILQEEINTRMITKAASKNGIVIADDIVAKQIGEMIAPALKEQPGVNRADLLRNLLRNQGMTEQGLVHMIRQSMMGTVLQASMQSGAAIAPRQEAVDLYRVQNETRTIEGFILPDSTVKDVPEAKDEVLKAFYESGKASRYAIPETRAFTIAVLSEENVKNAITIPDADLQKEYDKTIESYKSPEQRVIQQAVIDKQDLADKVATAVRDGKSLKDAVKSVTGKDTAYTGEQTITQAGLPKPIGDAAFAASVNQPTTPVKTPLGYHVLVIRKIIPAGQKSFDSVKDEIRKELSQGQLAQQLQDAANTVDDRLAAGDDINVIAREMNLKVEKIGPLGKDGATPDKHDALKNFAKDGAAIVKTVFDMNEGESAPVMQLSDGRYAAIHVDKVTDLSYKPYESVRADLEKAWMDDQRAVMNKSRAIAIQQSVAGETKTMSAAASENGATVTTFNTLKRNGEAPKDIGPQGQAELFDAAPGETVMVAIPSGYLIGKIKSVTLPDPAKISDADLKPVIDHLKQSEGQTTMLVYLQHLQSKSGVKINRRLLDMMYGENAGQN